MDLPVTARQAIRILMATGKKSTDPGRLHQGIQEGQWNSQEREELRLLWANFTGVCTSWAVHYHGPQRGKPNTICVLVTSKITEQLGIKMAL